MSGNDSRSGLGIEGREPDPASRSRALARRHPRLLCRPCRSGSLAAASRPSTETEKRAPVAVINRTAAERYWRGVNPIGKRLRMLTPEWREIVGVVDDVRHWGPSSPVNPEVYLPGFRTPRISLCARPRAGGVAGYGSEQIRKLSPELP